MRPKRGKTYSETLLDPAVEMERSYRIDRVLPVTGWAPKATFLNEESFRDL
jgi:hypothetical protein